MKRFFALLITMLFACLLAVPAFADGTCSGCHSWLPSKSAEFSPMPLAPAVDAASLVQFHLEKGVLPQPPNLPVHDVSAQRVDYSQSMSGIDGPSVSWKISVTHQHQRV